MEKQKPDCRTCPQKGVCMYPGMCKEPIGGPPRYQ